MQETWVRSLGQEDHRLEKGMATHSGILAYRNPWTEEPGWQVTDQGGRKESDLTQLSD